MKDEAATAKKVKTAVQPLTREEQAKVAEACLKHGSLVKTISKEYIREGNGLDIEDLVQVGYGALIKAVREWREDGGSSFVTIANLRIRDALRTASGIKIERREADGKRVVKADVMRRASSIDEPGNEDGESLRDSLTNLSEESQEKDVTLVKDVVALRAALSRASAKDRELLTLWLECHKDFTLGSKVDTGGVTEMSRRLNVPRKTVEGRVQAAFKRVKMLMAANDINVAPILKQAA